MAAAFKNKNPNLNAVANFFFFSQKPKFFLKKMLEEKEKCLMSGFKESTGSRAPGRDGDQDGTHGEEDKRAVEGSGLSAPAARRYLFHSTFFLEMTVAIATVYMDEEALKKKGNGETKKLNRGRMRP